MKITWLVFILSWSTLATADRKVAGEYGAAMPANGLTLPLNEAISNFESGTPVAPRKVSGSIKEVCKKCAKMYKNAWKKVCKKCAKNV